MPSYEMPSDGLPARSPGQPSSPAATFGAQIPAGSVRPGDRRRNPQWRARLELRARAEFSEMPGLHLTVVQAQRLFGLRGDICQRILDALVREGFLTRMDHGAYVRRDQH